jgi:uncharacterized protein (DUF1499 family)
MVALIISMVSFLLLLESHKKYTSEISIIFVPKSEMAAEDAKQIIGNMEVIPTKKFFYKKLSYYDEGIKNKIRGLSDIEVRSEKNSSIIKISASSKTQEDSISVSRTTAKTLFNVMGFYYDIKKDVDFRIIEGPITNNATINWFFPLIYSLLAGALSFFVINLIFQNIPSYSKGEMKEKTEEFFGIFKKTKVKPEITEEEVYEIKAKPPVTPISPEKKSPAPENLPFAPGELTFIDEDYFRNNIIKNGKSETKKIEKPAVEASIEASMKSPKEIKPSESADFHREPTKEELKKRLNQLLKGEL